MSSLMQVMQEHATEGLSRTLGLSRVESEGAEIVFNDFLNLENKDSMEQDWESVVAWMMNDQTIDTWLCVCPSMLQHSVCQRVARGGGPRLSNVRIMLNQLSWIAICFLQRPL